MVSEVAFHTGWEADDVSLIEIKEDLADIFIRRGVLAAAAAGISSFPREIGNSLYNIGRQVVDFADHDEARIEQVRSECLQTHVVRTPGLGPTVYAVDNSSAPQVAVKLPAGRKDYDPLGGELARGVERDSDEGTSRGGRVRLRSHCRWIWISKG